MMKLFFNSNILNININYFNILCDNQQEKINNFMINNIYKFWLGGFIEGEGSLTISIIKHNNAPHGILIQPEFNVSQHVNGLSILKSFKVLFKNKGHIHKKPGSKNVWVFTLKGINNLNDYLISFYIEYVIPYFSKYKNEEFNKFLFILKKLKEKSKFEKEKFIEIVKLIYDLNPDGKGKRRKRTLPEILSIIKEKSINK
jgi:LAGLIDADG endonuclease